MVEIIPVIDIRRKQVVYARCGHRDEYLPLEASTITQSADPLQVLADLLALHPFQRVYIADLDSIEKTGNNSATIAAMCERHPESVFWLDSGVTANGRLPAHALLPGILPIIGTENALSPKSRRETLARYPHAILSLDLHNEVTRLPWSETRDIWPPNIILMSLSRIGSAAGPNIAQLQRFAHTLCGRHTLYAAGGIRDTADLAVLKQCGIQGALLATALHNGKIAPSAL